jgi:hypothetical protein
LVPLSGKNGPVAQILTTGSCPIFLRSLRRPPSFSAAPMQLRPRVVFFYHCAHAFDHRGPKQKFPQQAAPVAPQSFLASLHAKRNVLDQRIQLGLDVHDPKALASAKSSALSALGRSPLASTPSSAGSRQAPSKGGAATAHKNYSSSGSEDDAAQPVPRAAATNRAPMNQVKAPQQLVANRVSCIVVVL